MDREKLGDILLALNSHESEVKELKQEIASLRHGVSELRLSEVREGEEGNSFDVFLEKASLVMSECNIVSEKLSKLDGANVDMVEVDFLEDKCSVGMPSMNLGKVELSKSKTLEVELELRKLDPVDCGGLKIFNLSRRRFV